jgi:2-oxo-4-hydroxy-4-carboxy--5-ureidoimidazoline (OHCU) decarboxylase
VAGQPGAGLVRWDQVNKMSRDEFTQTFGRLFQGSDWLAAQAYDYRPFADTHDLRVAFQEALFPARPDQQRELMASYPDLGDDDEVGAESVRHQSTAGLTRLHDEDHQDRQPPFRGPGGGRQPDPHRAHAAVRPARPVESRR